MTQWLDIKHFILYSWCQTTQANEATASKAETTKPDQRQPGRRTELDRETSIGWGLSIVNTK